MSNIERRRIKPSPALARRLAQALRCDVETLADEPLVVEIRRAG
jgi:transcriptional regulator with XRE-family HTH domain